MEQVVSALWGLLAAVLATFAAVASQAVRRWAEAEAQRGLAIVQQRLGEGAARVAGEIAASVATNPEIEAATQAMVDVGAEVLCARFADTVAKYGIPLDTLAGMVKGEIGKLGHAVR